MGKSSKLVERIVGAAEDTETEFPVRSAVATFLFKVMPVDGQTHPKELDRLARILSDDFGLDSNEAMELISHARQQENTIDALSDLARLLKTNVAKEELITLISHMWEMVFADGRLHETEILFVERVALLLDVPEDEVSKAMHMTS